MVVCLFVYRRLTVCNQSFGYETCFTARFALNALSLRSNIVIWKSYQSIAQTAIRVISRFNIDNACQCGRHVAVMQHFVKLPVIRAGRLSADCVMQKKMDWDSHTSPENTFKKRLGCLHLGTPRQFSARSHGSWAFGWHFGNTCSVYWVIVMGQIRHKYSILVYE